MEFRLLGSFEVMRAGSPVAMGGPRQRAVLAALLLRANESVSLDYLCGAAWEYLPASPHSNLRTYISGLRRRFRAAGEQRNRLINQHGRYQVVVLPGELDTKAFDESAALGQRALQRGEPATAAEHLKAALSRWRGRPLEDLPAGPALRGELARWEENWLLTVERHARARIDLSEGASVIGDLRRVLAEHPLREELWAQLMLALAQAGRLAEALEAFRRIRARLVSELGIEPGPRLTELHRRILDADPGLHRPRIELLRPGRGVAAR